MFDNRNRYIFDADSKSDANHMLDEIEEMFNFSDEWGLILKLG